MVQIKTTICPIGDGKAGKTQQYKSFNKAIYHDPSIEKYLEDNEEGRTSGKSKFGTDTEGHVAVTGFNSFTINAIYPTVISDARGSNGLIEDKHKIKIKKKDGEIVPLQLECFDVAGQEKDSFDWLYNCNVLRMKHIFNLTLDSTITNPLIPATKWLGAANPIGLKVMTVTKTMPTEQGSVSNLNHKLISSGLYEKGGAVEYIQFAIDKGIYAVAAGDNIINGTGEMLLIYIDGKVPKRPLHLNTLGALELGVMYQITNPEQLNNARVLRIVGVKEAAPETKQKLEEILNIEMLSEDKLKNMGIQLPTYA